MGVGPALALFLVATLVWGALPFLPGLREIIARRDVRPLPINRRSEVDIRHFARGFRRYLEDRFALLMDRCRESGIVVAGDLADGADAYVILPPGDGEPTLAESERDGCQRVVLSCGDLRLPADFVHVSEVYAAGDLFGGARSVYRAGMAEGSVTLGAGSAVLRWFHAGGELAAEPRCLLLGRLSADGDMVLASGCRFERLHASRITFGHEGSLAGFPEPAAPAAGRTPLAPEEVPHVVDTRGGRWLVAGDLDLAPGAMVVGDVVVLGRTRLGDGVRVEGSLKSRRDVVAGHGVVVSGGLFGERDVEIGEESRIGGPVLAERTLTVRRNCAIGRRETPTTAIAWTVRIEPGVRCYGTVRAHAQGDVLVPERTAAVVRAAGGGRS